MTYIIRNFFVLFFVGINILYSQNKIDNMPDANDVKCHIKTGKDFQKWVELRLLGDAYYCESSGEVFDTAMSKLGFDSDVVRTSEGLYEGDINCFNGDINIFGYKLDKISIYRDSGLVFEVYLEATPKKILEVVQKYKTNIYKFPNEDITFSYRFLTSKPEVNYPYGIENKAILIGKANGNKTVSIGFWDIDY